VLGPLLVFAALSVLLTWPLAAQFTPGGLSRLPGDGIDDPSLAWNLWWVKHALVDQPQNPFQVAWQFWPVGINLAFYTLTVLNGMLAIPLQAAFGVIPAYNLILLSSFVLSGLGAYLLCLDFLARMRGHAGEAMASTPRVFAFPALLGGALYAFASAKLFYAALGQGNIASSQWIPFAILYIMAAARRDGRPRDVILAALFVTLQAYAELTYASFLGIFVALVVLWRFLEMMRPPRQVADSGAPNLFGGSPGQILAPGAPPRWVKTSLRGASFAPKQSDPRRGIASAQTTGLAMTPQEAFPGQNAAGKNRNASLARFLARMTLLAVLVAIGCAPILTNMLPDLQAEGDFLTSGGGFADIFSADLAGYALPTQLHPLLGGLTRRAANDSAPRPDGSHFPVNKGQQIYLGYTALGLAAIGLWRGRRRPPTWFWAFAAFLFFLLTLGPSLRVAGYDLRVPLPFDLVAQLPFYKGNRYPSRYSVMLLACLAPLVASGAAALLLRASRSARLTARPAVLLAPGLAILLLFEHLSAPLPMSDLRVPPLYDRVAAAAGDFALLELPPGWRNGARVAGKSDLVIMQQLWNQTAHGKRLLGGNTSRNPEFKFQFFSEDPTLARLIAETNAADLPQHDALRAALAGSPITPADAARARDWAATWAIRYVMVHRDKLPATTEAALRRLLPVALVAEAGPLALYQVTGDLPPPDSFAVATDAGRLILAEGWSPPGLGDAVYAQRREARLLLPLGRDAKQARFDLWALAPGQEVTLLVDGRVVGSVPVALERQPVTFDLPPDPARPALSDVRLRFAMLSSAAGATVSPAPAGGTGLAVPVSLVVRSAGQETGDFAHIYVAGVDRSPNRRGYNLVALSPADGRVLGAAAFDTHADATASRRLAEWVRGLPPGTVVAAAIRDEAALNLGPEAVDALRALGSSADLRGRFRWGHALIGVTGGGPGTAQEAVSGWRVGQVATGVPITAPQVAAALSGVWIVK
jgi:hypothetical protein